MAKKVIPPIHASIQEENGSVAWTWYLFFQWIADNAGGADLSNYFTKEETEELLAAKANIDDLATVAFTGDYDDLTDKPTIPTATSDLVNDNGFVSSLSDLGITATAAEINILDGITATTTELNYTDGVKSNIQDQLDNKENTLTAGSNITLTTISTIGKNKLDANVDGIKVTATPTSNLALNFTKWYLGVAYNGYMNQSSVSGFTYGVGTITFKSSDASYGCVKFLRLKPSTTYTISCASPTSNHKAAVMCYNDNGDNTYKATTQIQTPTALPYSFTTHADPTQVYGIDLYSQPNTEITYTNLLLEEGNQATAYAPYTELFSTQVAATDTTYTAGTGINISDGVISNTQTVNNSTITITQGGVTKGSFSLNQASDDTIALDAGGGGGGYHPDLFDWKWADHQVNDVQWLRADTFSWQSGAVYEAAYQHLVDDMPTAVPTITLENSSVYLRYTDGDVPGANHPYCWKSGNYAAYTNSETPSIGDWTFANATSYLENYQVTATGTGMPSPETETIAGITISYYEAADGHKLVLSDQESNVMAIYNATGVAWYYIIDTTNQRFKLPRSKHNKYTTTLGVAGNGKVLGLTNGTNTGSLTSDNNASYNPLMSNSIGINVGTSTTKVGWTDGKAIGVVTDATTSGLTTTSMAQETDQYKYLYFYVGEFTQEAIENTAGINTEDFNDKSDTDFGNTSMIDYVIEYQTPNAGNNYTWYRKYKSGWVEQGGVINSATAHPTTTTQTCNLPIEMSDTNYTCILKSNDKIATTSNNLSEQYGNSDFGAVGTKSTTSFQYRAYKPSWYVCGMAA